MLLLLLPPWLANFSSGVILKECGLTRGGSRGTEEGTDKDSRTIKLLETTLSLNVASLHLTFKNLTSLRGIHPAPSSFYFRLILHFIENGLKEIVIIADSPCVSAIFEGIARRLEEARVKHGGRRVHGKKHQERTAIFNFLPTFFSLLFYVLKHTSAFLPLE